MTATFNAIGLAVADMATSLAFYRRLGLAAPDGAEREPHTEVELPGGVRLMWDTHASIKEFDPAHDPSKGGRGGPSLAFLCAGPAEVDTLYADLEEAGHETVKAPWDAVWGQRYAVVRDPDGHQVELFAWSKA
jgi:catechol 2,3-dioxygenase-like lactoylglutathione lyase family enzyme